MIISRSPLRMSFVGGGSDLRAFYQTETGAVLSTAINKYVFVTVNPKFDNAIRVAYSKTEEVARAAEVEHRLVRAVLQRLDITGGIEITTIADVPAKGTGLGSSSSFTVGLLHALNGYLGRFADREQLAAESCRIEIDVCGEPIGKQDQYAAAYGGLNLIEFHPDESVKVSPVLCGAHVLQELENNLLVLYTGVTRSASELLSGQRDAVRGNADKKSTLRRMVALTYEMKKALEANQVTAVGEILHENWMLKKTLTKGISTTAIDQWYELGCRHGATGGKILGAGAGGFLLFFAPPTTHDAICHALPNLRRVPIRFERFGSQIIFYNP